MSTVITKVCDRCGAAFARDNSNQYPVQKVEYHIPTTNNPHISGTSAKELCLPCRVGLSALITTYLKVV